jgi:protein tyrosine phosphatase (PTP) superfamily phosphohydrolase (DUF442 family)
VVQLKRRVLVLFVLALTASAPAFAAAPSSRPATWAIAVPAKGVENFYRVEPDLYRSGRPQGAGFHELQALGVKTILDVESPGDDAGAHGSSLKLFHIPMTAFGLRDDLVLEALRIMANPANRPLVVHCHLGADRTGAMIALYRVVVQGWSKEDAIREMDDGGYHHSSWWRNLDQYVAAANVERLRKELGIVKPGETLLAALGIDPSRVAGSESQVLTASAAPAAPSSISSSDVAPAVSTTSKASGDASPAAETAKAKPVEPAAAAAGDRH